MTNKIIIPNKVLVEEVVRSIDEGKEVVLRTKGNSMLPFIVGERDSIRLGNCKTYRRLDVVLAEIQPGVHVIHRIIKIEGENVTLMGDGNIYGTEKCKIKDIKALGIEVITPNGKIRSLESSFHRFLATLWILAKPFRRYILAIYRRVFL